MPLNSVQSPLFTFYWGEKNQHFGFGLDMRFINGHNYWRGAARGKLSLVPGCHSKGPVPGDKLLLSDQTFRFICSKAGEALLWDVDLRASRKLELDPMWGFHHMSLILHDGVVVHDGLASVNLSTVFRGLTLHSAYLSRNCPGTSWDQRHETPSDNSFPLEQPNKSHCVRSQGGCRLQPFHTRSPGWWLV